MKWSVIWKIILWIVVVSILSGYFFFSLHPVHWISALYTWTITTDKQSFDTAIHYNGVTWWVQLYSSWHWSITGYFSHMLDSCAITSMTWEVTSDYHRDLQVIEFIRHLGQEDHTFYFQPSGVWSWDWGVFSYTQSSNRYWSQITFTGSIGVSIKENYSSLIIPYQWIIRHRCVPWIKEYRRVNLCRQRARISLSVPDRPLFVMYYQWYGILQ